MFILFLIIRRKLAGWNIIVGVVATGLFIGKFVDQRILKDINFFRAFCKFLSYLETKL